MLEGFGHELSASRLSSLLGKLRAVKRRLGLTHPSPGRDRESIATPCDVLACGQASKQAWPHSSDCKHRGHCHQGCEGPPPQPDRHTSRTFGRAFSSASRTGCHASQGLSSMQHSARLPVNALGGPVLLGGPQKMVHGPAPNEFSRRVSTACELTCPGQGGEASPSRSFCHALGL